MATKNPALNVYLGSLKHLWIDHCKKQGQKPGAMLRQVIEHHLEKSETNIHSKLNPLQQINDAPDDGPKERFEVLLTPSEKAALETRAQEENCSQRRWVIDAIRAGLLSQPQPSMLELEVLGESNYQLLAIGRNLNQIAKAMNEGHPASITCEDIQQLRAIIDTHTQTVSRTLRASLERWKIT